MGKGGFEETGGGQRSRQGGGGGGGDGGGEQPCFLHGNVVALSFFCFSLEGKLRGN